MWQEQNFGRVPYPSRRGLLRLSPVTAQGISELVEMFWAFSTELGFVAGGTVALYLDASNSVICASAVAGTLVVVCIRHLLKAKGIYRPH